MATPPNKITGANAGGPRHFPMRTRWAARVAQFWRSAAKPSIEDIRRSVRQPAAVCLTESQYATGWGDPTQEP
jgi:hypothetical protein